MPKDAVTIIIITISIIIIIDVLIILNRKITSQNKRKAVDTFNIKR